MNDTYGSKGKVGKGTSKNTKSISQSIDRDDNAVNGIKSQSCDTQKGKVEKGTSSCRKSSNVEIAIDASPSKPRQARSDSLGRRLNLKRKDVSGSASEFSLPDNYQIRRIENNADNVAS